jgi:two-component system cell cycle sensor histidine kinase PleC
VITRRPTQQIHPGEALKARYVKTRMRIADFCRTVRISVAPKPEETWIADAELRLVRSSNRAALLLMPFAAFLISLAFKPWISVTMRGAWWMTVAVVSILIDFASRRLDRMTGRDNKTVAFKARVYVGMSSLFFITWCSMAVMLRSSGHDENHMLLVLILACSMAGSIVVSSAHPATAVSTFVIHAVFLTVPAALCTSQLSHILAALSGVFALLLAGQLVGLIDGVQRLLMLEHERAEQVQDLRAAKQESDRERARAIAAGKAKSQFLSNMNHELRTPMNAILGFSELIKSKALGNAVDKYVEYGEIIHGSGEQMLRLITDMLDLAKIEGGKLSLREADVALDLVILDSVTVHEHIAETRRIALRSEIERNLPKVFADERGTRQMIGNLLSNAIKFTQTGGRVTAFARTLSDGRIAFGVEDTGLGIAAEDQPHVFERFGKKRSDVTTSQEKGTGLGLAIVKGFAEAHDGSVELESAVGAGTRVTVYLPAERLIRGEMRASA